MSNKKPTAEQIDDLKDDNGRFTDEAYLPATIGKTLGDIFNSMHLPDSFSNDMLLILQGKEFVHQHSAEQFEALTKVAQDLSDMFTSNGGTLEEVRAGALWLETTVAEQHADADVIELFADKKGNADETS